MDKLRCIVVDDEPLAIKMLENFIERTPYLQLEASYSDPVLALSGICSIKPHLVFLDIQMPDLSGMELSHMIPAETKIIFTTAFAQYALDSYEVSALDFLLKPIRYQKFLAATEKARDWFSRSLVGGSTEPAAKDVPSSVFMKADGELRKVLFSDILFVEGMKDYVLVHLASQKKPLVTHITMKGLEDILPPSLFMRVHKSYIVQLNQICSVSASGDILLGETLIHVSDSFRPAFDSWLRANSIRG